MYDSRLRYNPEQRVSFSLLTNTNQSKAEAARADEQISAHVNCRIVRLARHFVHNLLV